MYLAARRVQRIHESAHLADSTMVWLCASHPRTINGGPDEPTLRALPPAASRSAAGWALGRRVAARRALGGSVAT